VFLFADASLLTLSKGHSAWGQFNLYGRVRPLDGLVSFAKEYVRLIAFCSDRFRR
jgi:hypothetical protein